MSQWEGCVIGYFFHKTVIGGGAALVMNLMRLILVEFSFDQLNMIC